MFSYEMKIFCLPLENVGEGGEISMSIDSPLHNDRFDLGGVMSLMSLVSMLTWSGLRGVRTSSMAGPDTGPYEYDLTMEERDLGAGWTLARLDATVRAILRAGGFELMFREDVPARVTISEYVEVAKAFFDGSEPKFVNAALDKLARERRPDEM